MRGLVERSVTTREVGKKGVEENLDLHHLLNTYTTEVLDDT